MAYEIKDNNGDVWGTALNMTAANIFAQALREIFREKDFTVHNA